MIYAFYLFIPFVLALVIVFVTLHYNSKEIEPIVAEVFNIFKTIWESENMKSEDGKEPFDAVCLRLFKKAYASEGLYAVEFKNKYFLYKTLILLIVASIPFLILFLVTKKAFVLGDNEWNEIYLYIVIVVPIILAFLLNKYVDVKQYRQLWLQHSKIKYHLEWRMMELIKDYEMQKADMKPEEAETLLKKLKSSFINDMCEYWHTSTSELSEKVMAKEENLFQEIGNMLSSK
jgi:hypothetical protein